MKKINFSSKIFFILMSLIVTGVFLKPCWADKPHFKAEHNAKKKEALITLDLSPATYRLQEQDEWITLQSDEPSAVSFNKKGEPALMAFTYFISIPSGAQVKNIALQYAKKQIKLNKPLRPIPEAVIVGEPPKIPIPDAKIYQSLTPYPEKDFEYSIGKQGTTTLLALTLYPFKYIGILQTLVVQEIVSVDIVLKTHKWDKNPQPQNAVDNHLKRKLVNADDTFFFTGGAQ